MIVKGNGDDNLLFGTALADTLLGYDGEDTLIGGLGDDILDGGNGVDIMDGGSGNDTYIVDFSLDKVVEYDGYGNDTVRASIDYYLMFWGEFVENLVLTGTEDLFGYGNDLDNTIYGNSGDNNLYGMDGDDLIKGGDGRDYINGDGGSDDMYGGKGDDIFIVSQDGDTVTEYAGQGIDKVWAHVSHALSANVEKLTLSGIGGTSPDIDGWGNDLNNEIIGNAGNNIIDGGGGADIMKGGDGNDQYVVDHFFDQITELANEGNDTVHTTLSSFGLSTNLENLTLTGNLNSSGYGNSVGNIITGNAGNNTLVGNGGNDTLHGGEGNDTLNGGEHNDQILPGAGNDLLIGGTGADTFIWSAEEGNFVAIDMHDLIKDFNVAQGDKIDVHHMDANTVLAGDQSFSFIGDWANGKFTAPGQIAYTYGGGYTFLLFNTDDVALDATGNAESELVIRLEGQVVPDASWFVL